MKKLLKTIFREGLIFLFVGLLAISAVVFFGLRTPENFPVDQVFTLPAGSTLREATEKLTQEKYVRSSNWVNVLVRLRGSDSGIVAGVYKFDRPLNAWQIAKRITDGKYGIDPIDVTIPEGSDVVETADILAATIPGFSKNEFIRFASQHEGYLFPETYKFLPDATPEKVLETLLGEFDSKTVDLADTIQDFGKPLEDVVIMASILEEEGNDLQSRRMIADILWRRIEIGMPLQVDAAFLKVDGKTTFDLTLEDLRRDSPYNTYTNLGLPPGPITNPGLESIQAAVSPVGNDDLFYLTGRDGDFYYAGTYSKHLQNKRLYLD